MTEVQKRYDLSSFLLISGDGRNTGKTTLACHILQQFSQKEKITTLKISSHFHEPTPDLTLLHKTDGFSISLENNRNTSKDSSRMLRYGAHKSFYIQAKKGSLKHAFDTYMREFHTNNATICESGALARLLTPEVRLHIASVHEETGILSSDYDSDNEKVILQFNGKYFIPSIKNLHLKDKKWHWK